VSVLHSVIDPYAKVVNGTEVTVHFKLKLLNVDEGEATNSDTGGDCSAT